ncbi:MAG: hypothetical protein AB7R55_00125 [Gemmatimonadales bacterium]
MKRRAMVTGALLLAVASTAAAQEPSDSSRAERDRCACARLDLGPDWTGRLSELWRLEDGIRRLRVEPRIRLRTAPGVRYRLENRLGRDGVAPDRLRQRSAVRFGPELRERLRFRFGGSTGRYRAI